MLKYCSMHCVNLGIAQWANASCILALAEINFFGQDSLAVQLEVLTVRFKKWCRLHGIHHSQVVITVGMMHLSDAAYPELTLKAYNGRVMVSFLATCCQAACAQGADLGLTTSAMTHLSNWLLLIEGLGRYLEPGDANHVYNLGMQPLAVINVTY